MSAAQAMTNGLAATRWDAVVIGGGFYGCSIATLLKEEYGLRDVLLIEREAELFARASFVNQARVHNGYHYPRSFTTAFRSRVNFAQFVREYADCIVDDFVSLYCIGAQNSLVTRSQFERFCREIGAGYRLAAKHRQALFDSTLVDAVYEVTECAFDARALARSVGGRMKDAGVQLLMGTTVEDVSRARDGLVVAVALNGSRSELASKRVFNCTYAGLNFVAPSLQSARVRLKYELAEIALITPPPELAGLGVTVMDGPFFSCMPFPSMGCHSLTHVRYTPHLAWQDDTSTVHPYAALDAATPRSRARYMIADARRYLPALGNARYEKSLFEIKTVLMSSEIDDGRPILFQKHGEGSELYSILGGKIDNIFDVKKAMPNIV